MSETKLANTGVHVNDTSVQDILRKYMLVDGFNITLDLEKSKGAYIYDSITKKNFLDFFSFVASNPIGLNHPKLMTDDFIRKIGKVAITKPSLSDIYVKEQAEFVDTFFRIAVPSYFKHSFFIEGGALAVENAIKAAIDWKVQKNFRKGYKEEKGQRIIHFKHAFHGRSGYTLSLTNTDPIKIKYFPKFDWPRITNPKVKFPLNDENLSAVKKEEEKAISEIKDAIAKNKDDIAGLIIEPIQGEGGDNQFRKEFFLKLREICDEDEIMFIIDEVQTGIGMTGKWWAHQHYVQPDIISFGKKMQVCGILSTDRIDEIEDNVFKVSSRINSTWGGNIVDMVRSQRILEIIQEDNLVQNAEIMGKYLLNKIYELQNKYPEKIDNGRGVGLFAAFDCETSELRNKIISTAMENNLIILGSGEKSLRFRPNLAIKQEEIDECFVILDKVLSKLI
jgi:L-lysine 6-transaminase